MAKKPKQVSADDILKQMYPDLMTSDDYSQQQQQTQQTKAEPSVGDLQREIAQLQGRLEAVSTRPVQQVRQTQQEQAPQAPIIDYDKAPNPIDDPAGYAKFVRETTQAQIDYEKAAYAWQNRQAQVAATRNNSLWDDFSTKYKPYAGDPEKVEAATGVVLSRAQAKGVDINEYMYGNTDQFMKDVAAQMDKLYGKPSEGDDDDDYVDVESDDEPDNRTAGLLGGSMAGGKTAATPKAAPQKYGILSQEVMAWQEKTGFHR